MKKKHFRGCASAEGSTIGLGWMEAKTGWQVGHQRQQQQQLAAFGWIGHRLDTIKWIKHHLFWLFSTVWVGWRALPLGNVIGEDEKYNW